MKELAARQVIMNEWRQLEASRSIDNFRIAAGEKDGVMSHHKEQGAPVICIRL